MPQLKNPKHEAYAQYLYSGETQLKAYLKAGYKDNSGAESSAARLYRNAQVRARVAELQERKAAQADITVERIAKMLFETHQRAVEAADLTNERQSAMDLAKLHGLIVDKAQVASDNVTWIASGEPMSRSEYDAEFTEGTVDASGSIH